MTEKEKDRIRHVADLLYRAVKPIRILSHISWPIEVRSRFFKEGARELPKVNYPVFDPSETLEILGEARRLIQSSTVDEWFSRHASTIEKSAHMLSVCGTSEYFRLSSEIYGTPLSVLPDETSTSYALACQFDKLMATFTKIDLGAPPPACYLAQTVASEMEKAVRVMFNDEAPEILVVDELSANALAGPKRIRIRNSACFTDKDINQLVHHEAYVHVATSLNGYAQPNLKILGTGHPGTTKTQEGLAVFAEFVTSSMDLDRMRRLADRVLAIQMSIEGADFLDVYYYFLERTSSAEQAFENTRRVFRGGVLGGGAPFTKDVVYLDGLLRVHNFLRAIVSSGRADCLRLLFCGKLDIEDIPVLYELSEQGLCSAPKYLPPWADDLRFLLCYLTYSAFLSGVDFNQIKSHYEAMLSNIP
ncbi:MAG: DUF1704 domain-containing protein [SAR324 cluster bacterium]|nr:DUF1704 domain-containing protein [SAR324 cluster bacterium]